VSERNADSAEVSKLLEVAVSNRARRILVLEDDADTAELFEMVLSDYTALVASSLAEAQRLQCSCSFDLYLVDEHLPDGKGIDFCRSVRRTDPNTPMLLCSADARSSVRREAFDAGVQAFMTKPVETDSMLGEVRSALEAADRRSFDAAVAELQAVREIIGESLRKHDAVLSQVAEALSVAGESAARAEEALLRARARAAYLTAGGSPAHLENLYPIVFRRAG
jgi:DNA-binding response OmpR family regulator